MRELLDKVKRAHVLMAALLLLGTILGSTGTWLVRLGIDHGQRDATNTILRTEFGRLNTNMEQVLQRLSRLEVERSEADRLANTLLNKLDQTAAEVDSMGDEVNRHVQEDREATWALWHRLDGLDHLGVPPQPPFRDRRRPKP